MKENEAALAYLASLGDPALYEQIAQTLVRGIGHVICLKGEGLLVYNRPGDVYMIASPTREGTLALCEEIPDGVQNIALHGVGSEDAEAVRRRFGIGNTIEFVIYAYYGACPPEERRDIRPLDGAALDVLTRHYAHGSRAYLADRIAAGVMFGLYEGEALAGFIGEHSEGAMGLLAILPEYRRRGMASALERDAVRRLMQRGYVPYNQVLPGNDASHSLQQRLGFTRAKRMCYWITHDEL